MKIFFAFVILPLIIWSCSSSKENDLSILESGKTLIQLDVKNIKGPTGYTLYYWQTLPVNQLGKNVFIESDTIINMELKSNHPIYVTLEEGNSYVNFFSIPNDTLRIEIDYKKELSLDNLVDFKGKTASISKYLTIDRRIFIDGPDKDQTVENYNKEVDKFFAKELKKLDSVSLSRNLPAWFVKIEKERIYCQRNDAKLNQFDQRFWMYNQFLNNKKNTITQNIKLTKINNYWLFNYFSMLSNFSESKYDTLLRPEYVTDKIFLEYTNNNIERVKNKISKQALSYFVASKISIIISNKIKKEMPSSKFRTKSKLIEEIIEENKPLISDTSVFKVLNTYKEETFEKYFKHKALKIGDAAPNFILLNLNDKRCKLSDYKGKVVLLNFWGTYCNPCIESIPKKNKLLEKYSENEFALLNICLDSNFKNWKEIINKNNFKGEHFICRGNWSEILADSYNISTVPHYVLVDKQGKIAKAGIRDSLEYNVNKILK